jgi:hypothetical protein
MVITQKKEFQPVKAANIPVPYRDRRNLYDALCRITSTRVYPKVSGLAAWSENCKWYSSLPLGAVVSLFSESVY